MVRITHVPLRSRKAVKCSVLQLCDSVVIRSRRAVMLRTTTVVLRTANVLLRTSHIQNSSAMRGATSGMQKTM